MPEKSKKLEFFRAVVGLGVVILVSKVIDQALPDSSFWIRMAASLAVILPVGLALDAALVFGYKTWRSRL